MIASNRYSLLTIDLDDTLWPCDDVIQRAEDSVHAWLARQAPRLAEAHDLASLRRHRRAVMAARPDIAHDITAVRQASFAALLADLGYDAALAGAAVALFLEHRNRVEPYADVVPALQRLARTYRLVSVTNGNADVARTPLRGLLHHSLTAATVGAQKPDPALFRSALDWAGVPPEEAVHLGDDPLLDVDAARRIGMATVWMNRAGRTWPEDLEPPDAEVRDLDGLLQWLGGEAHAL